MPTCHAGMLAAGTDTDRVIQPVITRLPGLLLLATIVLTLLYGGWIGLAVAAVVAVLVLAWVRARRIAVVVSGLLLLAILAFSAWQKGGWINVAVIAVMAVVAVLVFAWARSQARR